MPTLTTKLEAVNIVLGAVGEAPVSSLVNTTQDAAIAANVVEEISRKVQTEGWNFNTEENVPFQPDVNGRIALPENVAKFHVDRFRYSNIKPVCRGSKLYDAKNHTDIFKDKIEAEVTYLLDFDSLPETARYYIAVAAARVYHARYVGDAALMRFSLDDERLARIAMKQEDGDTSDANIFDSADMQNMLRRY